MTRYLLWQKARQFGVPVDTRRVRIPLTNTPDGNVLKLSRHILLLNRQPLLHFPDSGKSRPGPLSNHWLALVFPSCKEFSVIKHLLTTTHILQFIMPPLIRALSDKLFKKTERWLVIQVPRVRKSVVAPYCACISITFSLMFYSNDLSITTANLPPPPPFSEYRVKDARFRGRSAICSFPYSQPVAVTFLQMIFTSLLAETIK